MTTEIVISIGSDNRLLPDVTKPLADLGWLVMKWGSVAFSLQWRHNDHDNVSNHQPRGCLLNCLFRRRSKKTSKLRVTGLCVGNSPGPVNSPHKGPVTREMFPFDDVIMFLIAISHEFIKISIRRIIILKTFPHPPGRVNLSDSRPALQLSLHNLLKPCIKSRMKM